MQEHQSTHQQRGMKANAHPQEEQTLDGHMKAPPAFQVKSTGSLLPLQLREHARENQLGSLLNFGAELLINGPGAMAKGLNRIMPDEDGSRANAAVDDHLEQLTAEVRGEMAEESTFEGPRSAKNRELIRDMDKQTGNSGEELIKQMLRMKELDYKYVWTRGFKRKEQKNEAFTELEQQLYDANTLVRRDGVAYAKFGGQTLKKPKWSLEGGVPSYATNCSTAVQEALFHFLGGHGGTVDGVKLNNRKFRNLKEGDKVGNKTVSADAARNFQDGSWVSYLKKTGLGYEVKDKQNGLWPGDIISTGGHRLIFLGYVSRKRVYQKGPKKGQPILIQKGPRKGQPRVIKKARVIEAAMTNQEQGHSAIKDNREIPVWKIKQAGRLYDYKE